MTAEVAIITKQAIALAADSAVTVGREKVWKTANKLFSLGPKHDIAIMIYGAGDFLSLPWEVVVKEYRRRASSVEFATVNDCAEDFRTFLLSSVFDREDQQRYSIVFPLFDILADIAEDIVDDAGAYDLALVQHEINQDRAAMRSSGVLFAGLNEPDVVAPFLPIVRGFAEKEFKQPVDSIEGDLSGLIFDFFVSKFESQYASGVVVAGYGREEFFPSIVHFAIDGRWKDRLRCWRDKGCKDLNDPAADDGFPIIPFAQQDMPFLFMAGISTSYLTFLNDSLAGLLKGTCDELVNDYVAQTKKSEASKAAADLSAKTASTFMARLLDKVREEQYLPINRAVMALPKEEMAMMAEALVDLTSLKRKVDSPLETVGGPVDVAVISKGDGFIWIKRKHYFNLELNHDFLRRKRALEGDAQ